MVLFYLSQQNICAELHVIEILKQLALQLGEAGATS